MSLDEAVASLKDEATPPDLRHLKLACWLGVPGKMAASLPFAP